MQIRNVLTSPRFSPRVLHVAKASKKNVKIKGIRELPPLFKTLLCAERMYKLTYDTKRLLSAKASAIMELAEGKVDPQIALSTISYLDERIQENYLSLRVLSGEIPLLENELTLWKDEIATVASFILAAKERGSEFPAYTLEFLNSRINKLVELKKIVVHHLRKTEMELSQLQEERNNLKFKHSIGLLRGDEFKAIDEGLTDVIEKKNQEIEYLREYVANVGFRQVELTPLEKKLEEIDTSIAEIEKKYGRESGSDEMAFDLKARKIALAKQIERQKRYNEIGNKLNMLQSSGVALTDFKDLLT
jgi:hypothetical protein